jgi:hypothetical protein
MKSFEDLLKSHPASTLMSYRKCNPDGTWGPSRFLDLEFYYANAKDCSLPEEAPEEIRELWRTAQHLLVYAYFEYPFVIAADLYCTMVVEAALKRECAKQIEEYNRPRIEKGKKWRDPSFSEILDFFKEKTLEILTPEEAQFLYERLDGLRELRNSYAHPRSQTLYSPGQSLMIRTSEWLSAYYRGELKQFVRRWIEYSEEENKRMRELVERAKREQAT